VLGQSSRARRRRLMAAAGRFQQRDGQTGRHACRLLVRLGERQPTRRSVRGPSDESRRPLERPADAVVPAAARRLVFVLGGSEVGDERDASSPRDCRSAGACRGRVDSPAGKRHPDSRSRCRNRSRRVSFGLARRGETSALLLLEGAGVTSERWLSSTASASLTTSRRLPSRDCRSAPCSSALGPPHRADCGDRAQVLDQHPVDGESALA
jgi:hypothetical protein